MEVDVRFGRVKDLTWVIHLQRVFSNQLGFVPKLSLRDALGRREILVPWVNAEPAGYVYSRVLEQQRWTRSIVQAAVPMDLQRCGVGLATVDYLSRTAAEDVVQAWCREDLVACLFWSSLGFYPVVARSAVTARGKGMVCWRKPLTRLGVARLRKVPDRVGGRGKRLSDGRLDSPVFFPVAGDWVV